MNHITEEDAIYAATVAQMTGVPQSKLLDVFQGKNPDAIFSAEDRRALSRYVNWAAYSRRLKTIEAEVRLRHLKARTVFDREMYADDPKGHLADLFMRSRPQGGQRCQE